MSSVGKVIGSVLGAVLGFFVLFLLLAIFYFLFFCTFYVVSEPTNEYHVSELRIKHSSGNATRTLGILGFTSGDTGDDLESQSEIVSKRNLANSSKNAIAEDPILNDNQKAQNSEKTFASGDSEASTDLGSQFAEFNYITDGLIEKNSKIDSNSLKLKSSRRLSSLVYKKRKSFPKSYQTFIARPTESEQSYLNDQYDTFTRTLMLQKLVENSINNTKTEVIKSIKDPYSNGLMSVGVIVVVVKSFQGSDDFEFKTLKPGDLLRIVRFYVKSPDKRNSLSELESAARSQRTSVHSDIFGNTPEESKNENSAFYLDDKDQNYKNIYGTGILLNTFLEYDSEHKNLRLKLKKGPEDENEYLYLKDFPLTVVSLETTVLKNLIPDTGLDHVDVEQI